MWKDKVNCFSMNTFTFKTRWPPNFLTHLNKKYCKIKLVLGLFHIIISKHNLSFCGNKRYQDILDVQKVGSFVTELGPWINITPLVLNCINVVLNVIRRILKAAYFPGIILPKYTCPFVELSLVYCYIRIIFFKSIKFATFESYFLNQLNLFQS